jgi:hypothetical protein
MANFLKKECSNVNMNIAMGAIIASTAIVTGMKHDFLSGIKILMGPMLLKFKEKRPMIVDELNKFVDAVIQYATMEELAPEFIPMITNNAPGVKNGTIKFVE